MTDRHAEPDDEFDRTVRNLIDKKTKPLGALGQVEAIALQLARAAQAEAPRLESCELTIFAADHGIAAEGVSAYPQAVTREMVLNFLNRGAAANVFAVAVGATVQVVDSGVAGEPIDHPDLLNRRIGPGTGNCLVGPAMTGTQRDDALRAGRQLAEGSSADVLCFGEMGIGNTSSASLVAAKLLGVPVGRLAGRGTGLDDKGLARKKRILEAAAARTPGELDPDTALCEYGGFETVMLAGAMLGAAQSGKLVLVDGFIATVSALAASRMMPGLERHLVFAHRSAEAGHAVVLEAMGAEPLLDLNLRLGEGTGALLAWPLVRAAAAILRDMASFGSAGVSGKS